MMKSITGVIVLLGLLLVFVPAAGAYNITFTNPPAEAKIGDMIDLKGNLQGISAIAIYLYVIGPGLDSHGVTLDNLRIPVGGGLFTTAPVRIVDGSWQYAWDTSLISGAMQPGYYSIYAVAAPIDHLRLRTSGEPYASTTILFLPSANASPSQSPESPLIVFAALAIAGIGAGSCILKKRD
jgi:hypothetical protein